MHYAKSIRTARLELVPANLRLAELEIKDIQKLCNALKCGAPDRWPPPLNDAESQRWFLEMYKREPGIQGWGTWYFLLAESDKPRMLIGNGGFKGKPVNGVCEIGYSLLPEYQGRGLGSEAARALVAWAFEHEKVEVVAAETLPELAASIGVMQSCGMRFVSNGKPEEGMQTVRYEVSRKGFTERGFAK